MSRLCQQLTRPKDPITRVAAASFIGTAIELFNFCLFVTASALTFNQLFFPHLDPFTSTLAFFCKGDSHSLPAIERQMQ